MVFEYHSHASHYIHTTHPSLHRKYTALTDKHNETTRVGPVLGEDFSASKALEDEGRYCMAARTTTMIYTSSSTMCLLVALSLCHARTD